MTVPASAPAQAPTNAGGGDPGSSVPAPAAAPATPAPGDPAPASTPEVKPADPAPAPAPADPKPEPEKKEEPPKEEPPKDPAKPEEKKEPVVPEKYELKLAEGSKLPAAAVQEVADFAKANKLTQEQAQAVLDHKETAVKAYADQQAQVMEEKKAGWLEAIKADKELGVLNEQGVNQACEMSKRVLQRFGEPELINVLETSGMGNYPALVRFTSRIAKAMGEDKFISGPPEPAPTKSAQEIMYPSLYQK